MSHSSVIPAANPSAFRTWALGIAGLVGLAAVALASSNANAAECLGGYKVLPNQVPVRCETSANVGADAFAFQRNAPVADASGAAPRRSLVAESREDCQPGMYWGYDMPESGDMILACGR